MDNSSRCQSCGLPIHVGNFGTNASGSMNLEYCNLCFQKGAFTDSDMTPDLMIQMTTSKFMHLYEMDEKEAHLEAEKIIPTLKRWRNHS